MPSSSLDCTNAALMLPKKMNTAKSKSMNIDIVYGTTQQACAYIHFVLWHSCKF